MQCCGGGSVERCGWIFGVFDSLHFKLPAVGHNHSFPNPNSTMSVMCKGEDSINTHKNPPKLVSRFSTPYILDRNVITPI